MLRGAQRAAISAYPPVAIPASLRLRAFAQCYLFLPADQLGRISAGIGTVVYLHLLGAGRAAGSSPQHNTESFVSFPRRGKYTEYPILQGSLSELACIIGTPFVERRVGQSRARTNAKSYPAKLFFRSLL